MKKPTATASDMAQLLSAARADRDQAWDRINYLEQQIEIDTERLDHAKHERDEARARIEAAETVCEAWLDFSGMKKEILRVLRGGELDEQILRILRGEEEKS